jgi:hypothetical protein
MSNLPEPVFEQTTSNFYYDKQFKKYLLQFMAIFSGMKVQIGVNNLNSASNLMKVPVKGGSVDRVVAAILADNTQNKLLRLPLMSAKIVDMAIDEQAMKGTATIHRKVFLPLGESLPNGLQVARRRMPVPYDVTFELSIYASNADQQYQILEQIFMLFDPVLQIQTSDKDLDWTKINTVKLESINLEENYPAATDKRMLITSLTFSTTVYISAPVNYKKDYIKSIQIRLAAIHTDENTQEVVKDVDRATPAYEKLFDIDDYLIPPA